ncbi:hypothetical protein B0H65DRAFT_446967 [Neurospora tetraspora]|uniref:Uncharacterized protein n=1 Tax=Neurospora tetraspora TaxID=94610 RepID=A0AAE0MJT4_9PEZI|nr:hypothetical protein B0H65DRAFT_446967 [Neurospora tetraspora]
MYWGSSPMDDDIASQVLIHQWSLTNQTLTRDPGKGGEAGKLAELEKKARGSNSAHTQILLYGVAQHRRICMTPRMKAALSSFHSLGLMTNDDFDMKHQLCQAVADRHFIRFDSYPPQAQAMRQSGCIPLIIHQRVLITATFQDQTKSGGTGRHFAPAAAPFWTNKAIDSPVILTRTLRSKKLLSYQKDMVCTHGNSRLLELRVLVPRKSETVEPSYASKPKPRQDISKQGSTTQVRKACCSSVPRIRNSALVME